jgi:hypothetical protein
VNPFWAVLLTLAVVTAGTGLCLWLLHKAQEVHSSVWILEQVACPIIRILVLLFVISLIYPVIDTQSSSLQFWKMLAQQGQLNDLINILFFAGLLLAFIPLVSHPVFALPTQSVLTIALVFSWQYADVSAALQLLPSLSTLVKITIYMLLAYFLTRESSIHLSRWLDRRFAIEGSIRLISDAIYLVLQIPVMLIYFGYLIQQLPS